MVNELISSSFIFFNVSVQEYDEDGFSCIVSDIRRLTCEMFEEGRGIGDREGSRSKCCGRFGRRSGHANDSTCGRHPRRYKVAEDFHNDEGSNYERSPREVPSCCI